MAKVCSVCGAKTDDERLPAEEAEDCPECGGRETMHAEECEHENEEEEV